MTKGKGRRGHVWVHIAPSGYRKRPVSSPPLGEDFAHHRPVLMGKAKQEALGAMFAERAKVAYASELV
jgi:hypothetical protein